MGCVHVELVGWENEGVAAAENMINKQGRRSPHRHVMRVNPARIFDWRALFTNIQCTVLSPLTVT